MYTATIAFGSTAGTILPDELPSTEIIPISDEDQIDIAPSSKCVAEGMNVFVQLKDGRHYVGNLNNVGTTEFNVGDSLDPITEKDVVSIREV